MKNKNFNFHHPNGSKCSPRVLKYDQVYYYEPNKLSEIEPENAGEYKIYPECPKCYLTLKPKRIILHPKTGCRLDGERLEYVNFFGYGYGVRRDKEKEIEAYCTLCFKTL